MALRIVASRPDPAIITLPWSVPLEEWGEPHLVPLPRGLSRHVVRMVRLRDRIYAVKETVEDIAFREYRLLRDLQRLHLPAVVPQGVVTGRVDADGEELPSALLTEHLRFSLPYRSLFSHGLSQDNLPSLVDAMVVLLVRLHLADFFWGDVSLSNVLFRRSAGGFAAYLVDAETGELRSSLSTSMREYDLTIATENVFAELLDLQASESLSYEVEAHEIVDLLETRYQALWQELTAEEEFSASEMWRMEQRIERLNDLGFDVDELDIVTDFDGDRVRIQPKVVEAGHHQRELQGLTGLHVEDAQARRLLNDLASYTAALNLGREDRHLVANRWLDEIYEPIAAMIPADASGKLEPAEIFHEVLAHRWYLAERAGHDVDIFEAAADYIANVLKHKPDEAITAAADPSTWRRRAAARRGALRPTAGSALGLADAAGDQVLLVLAGRAQVLAVRDERAVAAVHRGALAGGHGQRGHVDALVVERGRAGGDVGEDQQGVGEPARGLAVVLGDAGQPRAEVEEPADEGESEATEAAGDHVGLLVVAERRVRDAVPAQDDHHEAEREQRGAHPEQHGLEQPGVVVLQRRGAAGAAAGLGQGGHGPEPGATRGSVAGYRGHH